MGANFLKANKILLDVANQKFIYPTDNKIIIINNKQTNRIKEKTGNMKDYREKQTQEISKLRKKLANIEPAGKEQKRQYSELNRRK